MKNAMSILMCFLFAGCAFFGNSGSSDIQSKLLQPLSNKVGADIDATGQIGDIVKRPEISQCAAYLKGLLASSAANDEMLTKLQALDTKGLLVSSLLKDFFMLDIQRANAAGIQSDVEKNLPVQCGAVQAVFQRYVLAWMAVGASKGALPPPSPLVGK